MSLSSSVKSWTTTSKEWFKPTGLVIDNKGNIWVAERQRNAVQEFNSSGESLLQVGSEGTGNLQFKEPQGIAVDKAGNLWITDTGNSRVQEISSAGTFVRAFGVKGTGNSQFKQPQGVGIDPAGHVWVGDAGNNRVQEFSATGEYIRQFGSEGTANGQFKSGALGLAIGMWIAIDAEGHAWVSDGGNNRIQEFSSEGVYLGQFGTKGTGNGQFESPQGVAVDTSGHIWVCDSSSSRVQEFTHEGAYLGQFGSKGTGNGQFKTPKDLAVNSTGHVWVTDTENHRLQQFTATGEYISQITAEGAVEEKISGGAPVAVDTKGNVWVTDSEHDRIEKFNEAGEFVSQFGSEGTGNGQFKSPSWIASDTKGNLWIVDKGNSRVQEFNEKGEYLSQFGSAGAGNGQFKEPTGIAVDTKGNVWVADNANNRVQKFNEKGEYTLQFGTAGSGNGQFKAPNGIATGGSGGVWVVDTNNSRVQRFNEKGEYVSQFGTAGSGTGQFKIPEGITIDSKGTLSVADAFNGRVEQFSENGSYLAQFGSSSSMPVDVATDSKINMWISNAGSATLEKWTPNPASGSFTGIHTSKTVYYTSGANSSYPPCGGHIEWTNLPCESLPGAQPGTPGLPALPTSTIGYNIWDEPETVTETFPATGSFSATTRTKKTTFDTAGRGIESEVTSTNGIAVPVVINHYDTKTGALNQQSGVVAGKETTISDVYNTLGQLESYTDADDGISRYEYDLDGRVTKQTIYAPGLIEKGKQTYTYDTTTGFLTKLVDSAAGAFTANYDVAGKITSETYPNKMTAFYTHNAVGDTTNLEYKKEAHCKTTCPEVWFNDTVMPSIHGETVKQASNLSEEPKYAYDQAGRLTEVQEILAGKGCKTRVYGYDEESNRSSLTNREPASEGKCVTEGGSIESHAYDTANRLTDTGIAYEAFGNITKLPGADAGGPEMEITTAYYTDNQAATQTQNGETFKYYMDPSGRVRETERTIGGKTTSTISHYAAAGNALAWTSEPESKWTRDIPGIDGTLCATQPNSGTVTLLLHDLQGNVIGKTPDDENETKAPAGYNSTEFGVPLNGTPPKYAWLGAVGVSSEQPTGLVTQDGITYVPQTGRPLQTQGLAIPSPDNAATPYAITLSPWVIEGTGTVAKQLTNAEEAQKALANASQPPGAVPSDNPGWWCSEEEGTCEDEGGEDNFDPEKGRNLFGCEIKWGWDKREVGVEASFKCDATPHSFELEIAVQLDEGYGKFKMIFHKIFYFDGASGTADEGPGSCQIEKWYRGWVYGRVRFANGAFLWSGEGVTHAERRCYEQALAPEPSESTGIEGDENQPPV